MLKIEPQKYETFISNNENNDFIKIMFEKCVILLNNKNDCVSYVINDSMILIDELLNLERPPTSIER